MSEEPIGNLSVPFSVFQRMFDRFREQHVRDMAAIGADLSWWFPQSKEAGVAKIEGLVPGRVVYYEHPHEKTRAAIVAEVVDAEQGIINVALLLKSGMWLNVRQVPPDPSVTGERGEHEPADGFLHDRWRWPEREGLKPQIATLVGAAGDGKADESVAAPSA